MLTKLLLLYPAHILSEWLSTRLLGTKSDRSLSACMFQSDMSALHLVEVQDFGSPILCEVKDFLQQHLELTLSHILTISFLLISQIWPIFSCDTKIYQRVNYWSIFLFVLVACNRPSKCLLTYNGFTVSGVIVVFQGLLWDEYQEQIYSSHFLTLESNFPN